MSNFLLNLSIKLLNIFQGVTVIKPGPGGGASGVGDGFSEALPEGDAVVGPIGPDSRLASISYKVKQILKNIAGPILIALGSVGVIYMVVLGVQYAKSENDDKRATVKRRLVNLAIGVVAMFALAALCMAIKWEVIVPELFSYMDN